jgi:bifunctional non-homologous end joining protein LigD
VAATRNRPDRVLFPETGFTRNDAVEYYREVSRYLLPHLKNRPISFKRYPDTIRGESFWEKDAPSFTPAWVKRVAVARRTRESDIEYIVVNNVKTLTWVASVGGIEIHPFLHRAPRLERATEVVFDLDPGTGATIADCCRVALILRQALDAIRLKSFPKVSGSKGLQVYVPLNSDAGHDTTEPFARLVADEIARKYPKLVVSKMAKQLRAKKVFIDWSQNAGYKTTVSVYSLRAKQERPYVSMPMRWSEIETQKTLYFEPEEALRRVERVGDLFEPVLKLRQHLECGGRSRRSDSAEEERRLRPPHSITEQEHGLPKMKSQSGRRLFVLVDGDAGNELWLDMHGKFKRWILRPDREGGGRLIAMPAGDFKIDPAYFRGEVPAEWQKRVKIEDVGTYELIEGSYARKRFDLYFTGHVLVDEWILEKVTDDEQHRSWTLAPVAAR